MNKKVIVGVLALLAAAAVGFAVFAVMMNADRKNPTAEVYLNGVLVRKEPLSQDIEFTINSENGVNIVKIENGTVRVTYADCPVRVCMEMGAVSGGAVPIVCLPHRVEIRIVDGEDGFDA